MLVLVALLPGAVACAPEAMTTSQACRAWLDMERNSPKNDELAYSSYSLEKYRDWSTRIDGVLGDSFSGMVEVSEATIGSADGKMPEALIDSFYTSYSALIRICGNPIEQ